MLSRTAENLFWMARDMERAENTARMLDVSFRMALLPSTLDKQALHFEPILACAGRRALRRAVRRADARDHRPLRGARARQSRLDLVADPARPGERARAAFGDFQRGLGESQSDLAASAKSRLRGAHALGLPRFLRLGEGAVASLPRRGVRHHAAHDAFRFIRLGTFIERADNTARILDVKYHMLLPHGEQVGGVVDYYQWGALLRSVGAFRAYRRVYHDTVYPWRIAELMILRSDMPRSLHHCYEIVIGTLDELAGKKQLECRRLAGQIYARLRYGRIDKIFQAGLHEFLTDFVASNNALGVQIQDDFLMTVRSASIAGAA